MKPADFLLKLLVDVLQVMHHLVHAGGVEVSYCAHACLALQWLWYMLASSWPCRSEQRGAALVLLPTQAELAWQQLTQGAAGGSFDWHGGPCLT